jgi:hypothetical protein
MTARFITVFTIASKRHGATLMEIVDSPPPTPQLESNPLSDVYNCLFNTPKTNLHS